MDVLARHPKTLLKAESAFELQLGSTEQKNPFVQSAWMSSPTCLRHPFPSFHSYFSLWRARRLVSLIVTALLLLLLGVGRGLVGHRNVVLTALETLGIATAAALAGFVIGKLVTR